jgi:hypothetical protein
MFIDPMVFFIVILLWIPIRIYEDLVLQIAFESNDVDYLSENGFNPADFEK